VAALTEREQRILEAVVRAYVETAEPAGSRTLTRRFRLGISPATVRNTMSDLEAKGLLYHPHTSAGRVPTDLGYRTFVNDLMARRRDADAGDDIRDQLAVDGAPGVEELVGRAAQVLGVITRELGVAVAPRLDDAVLERMELVSLADKKVLVVLVLRSGAARAIYMDVPLDVPSDTLAAVAQILNERLAGSTISEIRSTLPVRLRDSVAADDRTAAGVIDLFVRSAEIWLDVGTGEETDLHLGRASVLAHQPEFSSGERLRGLLELVERKDILRTVLGRRLGEEGLQVTIGTEHEESVLSDLTVITSKYRIGGQEGVIGVIGPTRMAYDRVIELVEGASRFVSEAGSGS